MLAALAHQAGSNLVVPLKITAAPPDSFRSGNTITIKATFAANTIPPAGGSCQHPGFTVRLYDAKLVETDPPRISPDTNHSPVKPVTPYLQQSGVPFEPLSGPNALTVEKIFEPFLMPAKRTRRLSRLYVGLFRTCDISKPKGIDETGTEIVYADALMGSYTGGAFFRVKCTTRSLCAYQPE
jgi:hypothetical protein